MKTDRQGGVFFLIPLVAAVIFMTLLAVYDADAPRAAGDEVWMPVRFVLPDPRVTESPLPAVKKQSAAPEKIKTELYVRNDTKFSIDAQKILARGVRVRAESGDVQVIIVHTHATEAYTPAGSDTYDESDAYRTLNARQNMLRVGEELAAVLEARGISTAHCETLCDYPSYSDAYDISREEIAKMLEKYPAAKVVIDLHRDAIITASGQYYRAAAEINGSAAAQVMFVVGTDEGGLYHPNWRDNMSFQLSVQQHICELYPELMRPMNVRRARFNQHFRTGSMLVEIGTNSNTLAEALYGARLFGECLADVLLAP